MSQPSFFSSRSARVAALMLLFLTALAIRLYDLTDLPLDFHPTRQLLSAIKARAMYFQTQPDGVATEKLEIAIRQAKLKAQVEPVVLERLVAYTYRFTGEQLWVARIYSSLFWLIGGFFLFLLLRDLVSFDAAIISTAYYLLFPYAVIASRSFQPDPLMVMLILAFWWMFARWTESRSWGSALLAGLWGGLAIYIKFSAAFFVIGGALGLALWYFSFRDLIREAQVWVMAIVGALPGVLYLGYGLFIDGGLGSQFSGRFVPALLLNPVNYLLWMTKVDLATGGLFVMLALLGFFLTTDKRLRSFMFGLWGAYLAYGLFFDYHVATHDYYHLPLIPIVAVSLSPLGGWFFARLTEVTVQGVQRAVVCLILIAGLFMVVWNIRNQMKAVDYRPVGRMWTQLGEEMKDKSVIALTEDYGSRFEYWGWKTAPTWPYVGDRIYLNIRAGKLSFEEVFTDYASRKDFFLVTDFEELERQPELKARLQDFPVYLEGAGFKIFNLRAP